MAIAGSVSPALTVWNTRRTATGIGGAYMIGILLKFEAVPSTGTTSMVGTTLIFAPMPFTSFSWPTVMRCRLAIDSRVSVFLG